MNVEVNEPIGGTWQMLQSTHPFKKTAAWAAQFRVPVAADGTTVINIACALPIDVVGIGTRSLSPSADSIETFRGGGGLTGPTAASHGDTERQIN